MCTCNCDFSIIIITIIKCSDCNNLVAESHRSSHQVKCTHIVHVDSELPSSMLRNAGSLLFESLPTFEDVCKLPCPTIHHVPAKARPALARALSTCLRSILHENTEESWKKLFMLQSAWFLPQNEEEVTTSPVQLSASVIND